MNIQRNKTSVIIICGATAVVFTIGYWIKYRSRMKQMKPSDNAGVEKNLSVEKQDKELTNGTIPDEFDKDNKRALLLNARNDYLERILPKEWKKIGQVKELYIYPLKSGRGKHLKDSLFTDYGISVITEGHYPLRDRMFLVYKEGSGEFRTGRNYPTIVLVTPSAVDKDHVKLEAVGMPSVTFKVPEIRENDSNPVLSTINLWWGKTVDCIDCGSEVARWISRFLIGTNNGLRLGYALVKSSESSEEDEEPWEKFEGIFSSLRNEETGLLSDLASYMVMSESSVHELNQKLDRPGPALQFRPNVVVSGPESFTEGNWDWIKIGENVVMRNVRPCSSFQDQRTPRRIQIDGKAPSMGIYCGLYQTGNVKIGDNVCVNVSTDKMKNDEDPKFESQRFLHQEAKIDTQNSIPNGPS